MALRFIRTLLLEFLNRRQVGDKHPPLLTGIGLSDEGFGFDLPALFGGIVARGQKMPCDINAPPGQLGHSRPSAAGIIRRLLLPSMVKRRQATLRGDSYVNEACK
jgi:hypothetical protein